VPDDLTENFSWWHLPLTAEGVDFDFRHHPGTRSTRPWTRGNAAVRFALMVAEEYNRYRQEPPDVAIAGHNHIDEDSGNNHVVRGMILPAWCLSTAFSYRLGYGGTLSRIGGLISICKDGHAEHLWRIYQPRRRKRWKPT
jgi:hypothetical protein